MTKAGNSGDGPFYLLTLEMDDSGDQRWLFRNRDKALSFFLANLREDKAKGWFRPAPMTDQINPDCPRRGINKIATWLATWGNWPYNSTVRWSIREVSFADDPPSGQDLTATERGRLIALLGGNGLHGYSHFTDTALMHEVERHGLPRPLPKKPRRRTKTEP